MRHRHVVAEDPLCKAANELSAPDFFRSCLENYASWVRNVQIDWLSSVDESGHPLESALAELPNIALLGTLDLFDESLVTWEYTLTPLFPGISFHYLPQNIDPISAVGSPRTLGALRQLCGNALFDELSLANTDEIQLFEAASSIVKHRFSDRADAEHWLHEFRERNRRLEHQSPDLIPRSRSKPPSEPGSSRPDLFDAAAHELKRIVSRHCGLGKIPTRPMDTGVVLPDLSGACLFIC